MTDLTELYAEQHTAPEPPLLARLTRETHLQTLLPRMSSGHVQGRLLSLLSHLIRPRRILKLGRSAGMPRCAWPKDWPRTAGCTPSKSTPSARPAFCAT